MLNNLESFSEDNKFASCSKTNLILGYLLTEVKS